MERDSWDSRGSASDDGEPLVRRVDFRSRYLGRRPHGQKRRWYWVALWRVVRLGVAALLGTILFDRVLMPIVVRHETEVRVPQVVGLSLDSARSALTAAELDPVVSPGRYDLEMPAGSVLDASPAPGLSVKPGRQIFLTVSLGEENRLVPDLRGLSTRLATIKLQEAGLHVESTDQAATDEMPPGQVVATHPPAGAPVPGEGSVALLVSRKKAAVPLWMPDLEGRPSKESAAWLESCGLRVQIEKTSLPGRAGEIVEQDPAPGSPVLTGDRVILSAVSNEDSDNRWR